MKCIIIGAGNFINEHIVKESNDLVICADAGYMHAKNLGIIVDLVVGDFDSMIDIPKDTPILRLPQEKNETDLYIAIEEGIKRGYQDFDIYGALGGRIEHSIANIQILASLCEKNISAKLYDNQTVVELLPRGTYILDKSYSGYLSLFSYSPKSVITLKNLKYEVNEKTITSIFPLGIDNEFIGESAMIKVHEGLVLSIINKKND